MTEHSTPGLAMIDADAFSVRRTIEIAASVDAVWRAITEPELISQWFGEARFDGGGAGAEGTLSWPDHGAVPVRIESIDAPRSIVYRWTNHDGGGARPERVDEARSTVFEFTLAPTESGTILTVVETGFETMSDPVAALEDHRGGWNSELDELVALLVAS
jgi:uncharacterized protein YndB with AHSA1/START domain